MNFKKDWVNDDRISNVIIGEEWKSFRKDLKSSKEWKSIIEELKSNEEWKFIVESSPLLIMSNMMDKLKNLKKFKRMTIIHIKPS